MPDFALELSLAPEDDAAVVAQWEALRAAGLPSQADHRSMTNAPHVTLVAARSVPPAAREQGAALLRPLLPAPLVLRGLLLLGEGPRVTVAHLVEPPGAVAAAVQELRGLVPDVRHPVWTPHLTLARRVPRGRLGEVLDVLAGCPGPRQVHATRLRWWDPDAGTITELLPAAGPRHGGGVA